MLKEFLDFTKLGGDYASLIESVKQAKKCSVCGMGQSEKVVSSLNITGKVLYIASDFSIAKKAYELFKCICPSSTFLLAEAQDNLTYKNSQSSEVNIERIKAIYALSNNKADVVCASVDAIMSYLPNKEAFDKHILKIKVGDVLQLDEVKRLLVDMGYTNEALVSAPGQFSSRGDILDIFPINTSDPFRIELFDIERNKIIYKYCEKDQNGNPVLLENRNVKLFQDKIEEATTELNTLLKNQVEINAEKFPISVFDSIGLTPEQAFNLEAIVDFE